MMEHPEPSAAPQTSPALQPSEPSQPPRTETQPLPPRPYWQTYSELPAPPLIPPPPTAAIGHRLHPPQNHDYQHQPHTGGHPPQYAQYVLKTSDTHPISLTWTNPHPHLPTRGDVALSSCPGKQIRLRTPVHGKASVKRDITTDFERFRALGVTAVICCLYDNELEFLGVPWPVYAGAAVTAGIRIVRIPMVDGDTPERFEHVHAVVLEIFRVTSKRPFEGNNVVVHCRGGIGRAALVTCCYLLYVGHSWSPESAIRFLRQHRSPKAIENPKQEDFVKGYFQWLVVREHGRANRQPQVLCPPGQRDTRMAPVQT